MIFKICICFKSVRREVKSIKILKRVLFDFGLDDFKHIGFLLKCQFKALIKCDWHEVREAYYWIKIHIEHDSTKIR